MFTKRSCALGIVLLSLSPLGHAFFDALLSDGARSEALQDAMDKVSKTCNTANQFAKEYVAMAPENRIFGEVTNPVLFRSMELSDTMRSLEMCRESIENSLQEKVTNASGDSVAVVADPGKDGFEFNGSKTSLSSAYKTVWALERDVLAQPLEYCLTKQGNITAKGLGANWEPLDLFMVNWKPQECSASAPQWSFDESTPDTIRKLIKGQCPDAAVKTTPFKIENVRPNLLKKTAFVSCQKPRQRTAGAEAYKQAKIPLTENCPQCLQWVK